ncbi:MAG: aspartate aminotransferase family protein, partial [Pseudomonadota bacterium]
GTLSGCPVSMAAGLKTLELIDQPGFYESLNDKTRRLTDGFKAAADAAGVPMAVVQAGGMFGFIFSEASPVSSYEQVAAADIDRFRAFFHGMLERGVYLAPSAFEAGFISAKHSDEEIDQTVAAAAEVLKAIA